MYRLMKAETVYSPDPFVCVSGGGGGGSNSLRYVPRQNFAAFMPDIDIEWKGW